MTGLSVARCDEADAMESRLATLLESDAIDLAGISAAIRERPGLQRLVLTMSESLSLAPTTAAGTVEEAAVVLGKNRLRVLVQAWLETYAPESARVSTGGRVAEIAPEVLYLSSFFRWLGFDSADGAGTPQRKEIVRPAGEFEAGEQVAGLTDLLMRDIVSLIPYVDPVLPNQHLRAAARAHARSREESAE